MSVVYNYFHIIWTTFNNNQLHPKVDQIKKRQCVAQCIMHIKRKALLSTFVTSPSCFIDLCTSTNRPH